MYWSIVVTDPTGFWLRLWKDFQTFCKKMSLRIQCLVSSSLGAWNIRMLMAMQKTKAWLEKFQGQILKTIRAICYFELRFCGSSQLGLKS